ncbi:MAG: hypothetical protein SFY80_16980 [Verrucomicrobiota bacterium]|nr:hypothetical protein [Verrucomicrobiota bacterium]
MARDVNFTLGGQTATVQLEAKIDRKSLYGYAAKTIEKDGRSLSRGWLCPDGKLLRRESVAMQKIDPEGTPFDEPVTEANGEVVSLQPSSFEQAAPMESVPLKALIGFNVRDVYPLTKCTLAPGLYKTVFSYRKSIQPYDALVLVRAEDAFLLVGQYKVSTMVGLSVAYEFFDSAEDAEGEGEDLDFSMV